MGPYRILRRLEAGGMGQVSLGRSAGGRLVAVKVIRPELAGEPTFRAGSQGNQAPPDPPGSRP